MKKNSTNQRYPKEVNSEIYIDDNILKNENRNNYLKESSNILLSSLEFFFNAYEMKNHQRSSKVRFIISFEEIISLIHETILSQQNVDNLLFNNKKNNAEVLIQKINQKFISYISNSIYTLEILDKTFRDNIGIKRGISNFNFHTIKNSTKKKKTHGYKSHISSPSNFKNKINYIFENIYQEVFINDNDKKKKNKKKENSFRENHKDKMQRTKSAILGKKSNSPLSFYRDFKKQENKLDKNKRLFKTINSNGRTGNNSNTNSLYIENKYNTALSTNKKEAAEDYKPEKYLGGYKTFKNTKKSKLKNKLKCSDIFLACENINKIKNSGTIKSLQKNNIQYQFNEYDDKNSILRKSLKNLAVGIQDICNNSNDVIGYEEINLKGSGIKKIIVSNTHKPSNFTNKLLISGQKYINDFKQMDKFEKKRNLNSIQY
jgi:hypothetical protein